MADDIQYTEAHEYVQEPLPGMPSDSEMDQHYSDQRARRTLERRHSNAGLVQEMHQLGGVIDSGAVSMLQMQALIDVLLTDDQRAELELLFEDRIGLALENTVANLRRQKLTQPLNQPVHTEFHRNPRDPNGGGGFIGPK